MRKPAVADVVRLDCSSTSADVNVEVNEDVTTVEGADHGGYEVAWL